jgi:hypothetical protein
VGETRAARHTGCVHIARNDARSWATLAQRINPRASRFVRIRAAARAWARVA